MYALDGNPSTWFHTNAKTSKEEWWKVVTVEMLTLTKIILEDRGDCCGHRFSNIHIEVGVTDESSSALRVLYTSDTRSNPHHLNGATMTFDLPSFTERVHTVRVVRGHSPRTRTSTAYFNNKYY